MCVTCAVFFATLLAVIYGAVPPSGKCNTRHIETIPMDAKTLVGKWDVIYVTDNGQTTDSLDHLSNVITPNEDHTLKLVSTTVLKDKSSSSQEYTLTIVDGIVLEDAIDNGKPTHFHAYPLAIKDDALIFYRCADVAKSPVDSRYIAVKHGKTLSDESLKVLLAAGNKYNFKGELVKLPNQHS